MSGPGLDNIDSRSNILLETKITRFIHVGLETPKYYPGCWNTHKYFEPEKLPALDSAFTGRDDKYSLKMIKHIIKVGKDGWYTRFEPIAFVLAKSLLITNDDFVKEAIYAAAIDLCDTAEKMMIFNKYTRLFKTGNGQGWCRSIRAWYLKKDPLELAKDMTKNRARFGRSHKTLLRKSHIKIADGDNTRDAIIKYAIYGLKHAISLCASKEGTKEVLDYIQQVEDLRHCEDPVAAASIVSKNNFTLEHVPCHLLTAQEVWNAVLPQMSLRDILLNLQRIHNMGFLTDDSTTTAIIVSLMNNQDIINMSEVTPIEVYITMSNYKKKIKPISHTKAKIMAVKETRRRTRQIFDPKTGLWEWSTTKRHPTEIKNWGIERPPNKAVIASLNKLFDQAWLTTKPTNMRYLITLDMRHHMFKGRHFCKRYRPLKKEKPLKRKKPVKIIRKPSPSSVPALLAAVESDPTISKKKLLAECFYHKTVTPGHAAIILALQILKREKNSQLAVFTEEGIQIANLERRFINVDEAEYKLRSLNLGRVQLDAPIKWASDNKADVDVFINIIDRSSRYMELDHNKRGGRGCGGRYGKPPIVKKGVLLPDHCPVRALQQYRSSTKNTDAKLIVMNLASHRAETTDGSHVGVLDVVGIDEHVPKLLDAFALGYFN